MKHPLLFTIVACAMLANMAHTQTWTSLSGPQVASNVKDISITSSGSTLYIADGTTSNSYVMKSTNTGTGWKLTGVPYSSPVVVLVKPDDATEVVVAKNGELLYNGDGGDANTWVAKIADVNLVPLCLAALATDNSIMLLGRTNNTSISTDHSIWRSSNGGSSWTDLGSAFTYETNVNDFAPYPNLNDGNNRDRIVFAVGSASDGTPNGATESAVPDDAGLWKSDDYGATWEGIALGNSNLVSVTVVPKTYQQGSYYRIVIQNVSGTYNVRRSTDLGSQTWATELSISATARVVRWQKSSTYVFLATSAGVYKSSNEGDTWTLDNDGMGTDINVQSLATTADAVFAGTTNSLYKSTDNGNSWINIGDMNVSSVEAAQISTIQYAWAVTKDNNIAARYTGSSWERETIGAEGTNFSTENIYRNPSTGKLFAAGALSSTGALCSSTNDGTSYTPISITNYTLQTGSRYHGTVRDASGVMYAFGGGTLTSGGSGWRNVFNSTDEGTTWNAIADVGGNGLWVYDLVGPTGSTLYAAASDGNVYKSTNGGTNWTSTVDVGAVARSIAVNPAYPTVVYAGGDDGLWKYNGTSWSQVASGTITNVTKVMMHPSYQGLSDYVWIVSSGGTKVYKTTNGGTNWTDFSTGVATPITTLGDDGVNKGYSYLSTADGAYQINEPPAAPGSFAGTIAGGNPGYPHLTWSYIESDLATEPFYVYRVPWACSEGYCPNKSCGPIDDAVELGPTSNSYYNDTETAVANCGTVGITVGMVGYYATATDNIGQVSSNTANILFNKGAGNEESTWTPQVEPEALPTEFSLSENFPNPFNPVTTIRYTLPVDVQVNLTVVDVLGREVSVLVNERQTAGYKSVEFDATHLASGMYLYKLVAGVFTNVKKLMLLK